MNLKRVNISLRNGVRLSFAYRVGLSSRHCCLMVLFTVRLMNLQIIGRFPLGFCLPNRWHTLISFGLRLMNSSSLKNFRTISVTFSPLLSLGMLSPLKINESRLSYWSMASVSYFCSIRSDCNEDTVFCNPLTRLLRFEICVSFSWAFSFRVRFNVCYWSLCALIKLSLAL